MAYFLNLRDKYLKNPHPTKLWERFLVGVILVPLIVLVDTTDKVALCLQPLFRPVVAFIGFCRTEYERTFPYTLAGAFFEMLF